MITSKEEMKENAKEYPKVERESPRGTNLEKGTPKLESRLCLSCRHSPLNGSRVYLVAWLRNVRGHWTEAGGQENASRANRKPLLGSGGPRLVPELPSQK